MLVVDIVGIFIAAIVIFVLHNVLFVAQFVDVVVFIFDVFLVLVAAIVGIVVVAIVGIIVREGDPLLRWPSFPPKATARCGGGEGGRRRR